MSATGQLSAYVFRAAGVQHIKSINLGQAGDDTNLLTIMCTWAS
jgi:hypothetical protein